MRRRIEASASSSSAASGPLPAVPTASVVIPSASSQSPEVFEDKEMAADMDVDTRRQGVGEITIPGGVRLDVV